MATRSQLVLPCSTSSGAAAKIAASQGRRRPARRDVVTATTRAQAVRMAQVTS